ncbi:MAG TPA: helix-turn-helix domain-containing protein, partial [Aggregicoccus sp.]|nr:helix-turn-helix domain-containing protein [Aggregicoccus sp.]
LNVVQILSPPLRERREDLPELIRAFLQEACAKNGRRQLQLSSEALSVMAAYDYPGNVRELRNLVERLAILCEGPTVSGAEARELLPAPRSGALPAPPAPLLRALEALAQPAAAAPAAPGAPGPGGAQAPGGFQPRADKPFREQVEDAEREIIQFALAHTQDNVTEAARLLDLERGHFYKKMKALGLRRGASEA